MNVERMLRVADMIEKAEVEGLGFNMATFYGHGAIDRSGRGCGTTACLAGWATIKFLNEKRLFNSDYILCDHFSIAKDYFELTHGEACELFGDYTPYHSTHCEGAAQLRRAALTGEFSWPSKRKKLLK